MSRLTVIPAIDLKDGRCVRLRQGRAEDATVYSEDPVGMARHWVDGSRKGGDGNTFSGQSPCYSFSALSLSPLASLPWPIVILSPKSMSGDVY